MSLTAQHRVRSPSPANSYQHAVVAVTFTKAVVLRFALLTFKCCREVALYSSLPGSRRLNITLSAPLQYSRILLFSLNTTDMRRLVLLKSRMQRSSYTLVSPMISIVTLFGVRSMKTTPKFLAAETSADSSGDWAWYFNTPACNRGT